MNKKRHELIRDCCFDKRLPDYFNAPYLEIKNENLVYPTTELQLCLPGFDRGWGLRTRLGRFFEILAQGIYGGKIGEFYEFSELNGENMRSEPDITHQKTNILREVKATHTKNSLKLIKHQMEKYLSLQMWDYFQKPPIIRFEIFRHDVKGLLEIFNKNELEGIVKELTEGTKAMISFPFSVMYRIYQANIPFTGKSYGEGFYNSTRFHASGLNHLLAEPEETFKKLGIEPEFFEFQKKSFPWNVTVNERKITPFPVLIIDERNPTQELENLKEISGYKEDEVPF